MKIFILLALLLSCKNPPIDVSIPAAEAGDLSLVMAINDDVNSGYALIRTSAGSAVGEYIDIIVPKGLKGEGLVLGCESKDYPFAIDGSTDVIKINVSEFVPHNNYPEKFRCDARVLVQISGEVGGEVKTVRAIGVVNIISLSQGYTILPIDSPYAAWKYKYKGHKVQYTTSGRSVVEAPDGD